MKKWIVLLCLLICAPLWAADNIQINEGTSGKMVATEETGGANYQKIKLIDSTAASTTPTGVAASPLQVSLANTAANATPVVVDLGANNDVTATLGAETTKVIGTVNIAAAQTVAAVTSITNAVAVTNAGITTIAGAVAGTEMQVDVLTMPSTAVTNAGITSIDGKITACNTGAVVLAAGTAEIGNVKNSGTFAVQAASTIADGADVTLGAKADNKSTATDTTAITIMSVLKQVSYMLQNPASRAVTNAGTFAVQAVCTNAGTFAVQAACTLAAETTKVIGTVNIAASQTIATTNAGTFAVQESGSALTALQVIDNFISGSRGLVTEDNSADIKTAVQLIDNTVATEGSAALTSGTQVYGKYDSTLPTAVDDGDAVNILTDKYGRALVGTDPNIVRVEYSHTDVSTAHEVIAASASNYVYITSFILSVDTASSYWFEDADAAAITGIMYLAANGGVSWTCAPGSPLKTKTVNKGLNIKSAGTGKVGITMTYYLAP